MKILKNFFFFLTFISYISHSQTNHEFYGAIKLKGDDKKMITYRLVFAEKNGLIKGYSVTDLDGSHETKNLISGSYDKKNKIFTFKEDDILYTKSKFSEDSFCFVNFTGKVKLIEKTSKLEGEFKGLFNNKTKCIDGTLTLIGSDKIFNLVTKVNKKIQKSKKIDETSKEKYNPLKILDSLKINKITKDEDLIVFTKSTKVTVSFYDDAQEDGDIINILQNNQYVLRNYKITKNKKNITLDLAKGENEFTIEAVNEGSISHCTARIEIIDEERSFDLLAILKKDDKAKISIMKR